MLRLPRLRPRSNDLMRQTSSSVRSRGRRFVASAAVAALWLTGGCTCGSGPYQGDYLDEDRPQSMKGMNFIESEKGEPGIIGCADGQREGFSDLAKNPRVAGCVGAWSGNKNLRDKPTGQACGDDLPNSKCGVPADVCAPGWHVCGFEGKPQDIRDRVSFAECDNAGPGRFNAAVSHSPNDEIEPCPTITESTMLPCMLNGLGAEAACCGTDCKYGKCKDGVWKGKTKISRGTTEGCGSVSSEHNGGVMCCFDGTGNPGGGPAVAADANADAPAVDSAPPEGAPEAGGDAEAAPAAEGDAKAEAAPAAEGDAKAEGAPAAEGDAKAEGKAAADAVPKRKAPAKEQAAPAE